ncbi:MAG: 16S rRNA (adenine(1518)-N(6)/adenine(1519)-N(6))-dimethyltransferase RsmA [Kiritimatiellae bacterium]|jgi:16S rRNA (adenine1518-N6/adenine1519-N6)-dimethyltransferase|nr:16S rRNA (adenine(1518)-N(6)/adenine(1519)-N(6))-dimethyltransferase RsmA [Kiritimatiellia bacterium]
MNLTSKSDIRDILNNYGLHPNKRLGQNFLVDKNIINIIVDAIEITPDDVILEVGPGLGALTDQIVKHAKYVKAVEKDHGFIPHLTDYFKDNDNFEIINSDILDIPVSQILNDVTKFVSNLPYSCGTRILVDFILANKAPKHIVVMVQLEVAERIIAKENTSNFGLLSLLAGVKYDSEIVKIVSPNCFWPRPDVRSAVVKLVKRETPLLTQNEIKTFRKLTKTAFSQRRKKVSNSLRKILENEVLEKAGINPGQRPEEVNLDQWVALTKSFLERNKENA